LDAVRYSPEMIICRLKEATGKLTLRKPTTHVFDFIDKYIEENAHTRV
jgi:hypothetical protein